MHNFSPVPALIGGALIGLAVSLFLLTHGRVAGISDLFGGLLRQSTDGQSTRVAFIAGLLTGGVVLRLTVPAAFESSWPSSLPLALGAGLFVGFGAQLGNGCTSGHGICGVSRLSTRSIVATVTFMATAFATAFAMFHLLGGGS